MRIVLCQPSGKGYVHTDAAKGFHQPCLPGSTHQVMGISPRSSLLTMNFNLAWAAAVNCYEKGECDAFAMIHDDVCVEPGWLDVLVAELEACDADVLSAVIPIKDDRGLTSTAVDDTGDPWRVRRLTMKQAMGYPETFGDEDVMGELLLNTGLWVCKLGPWCLKEDRYGHLKVRFHIKDEIRREDGQLVARVSPEDWEFSRALRSIGLTLKATRKVKVRHAGEAVFANDVVWGWDEDYQNAPRIAPTGFWHGDPPDGYIFDAPLCAALTEFFAGKSVLDLGCGRGDYVKSIPECTGIDGNPRTKAMGGKFAMADVTQRLAAFPRAWVLSLEVGEHIPTAHEHMYLDNLARMASEGIVISWAAPGTPGMGHVNCRPSAWVTEQMGIRGFNPDPLAQATLRERASIWKNVMVFVRKGQPKMVMPPMILRGEGVLTPAPG